MVNQSSYYKGIAAEDIVADHYKRLGYVLKETRFKSAHGEIDLIFMGQREWVFVEVKCSKTFDTAAARILPRQIQRIYAAAQDYLSDMAGDVDCRFDAALVDKVGRVEVIENAFL
ncbi:hypothetical protein F9L33_11990 [Amylibacter sp. SFDW26]|uniref:YraN family protein n=1 Tax=Amylibacter sp. SFDW26 TaxID=2652722 RepID=UPI001261EC85|nr:YraN family protein [Amylibacter sp. SFDW26]KAB7613319.1 hypothetical protein F9L33_11990 [Amylibacter sp. SFDW26]